MYQLGWSPRLFVCYLYTVVHVLQESTMPDKQFIEEMVKAHNDYRSRHQVSTTPVKQRELSGFQNRSLS